MSEPSSQAISKWVVEHIELTDWVLLSEVALQAVQSHLKKRSPDECADLVDKNLKYVAEHLRDEWAELSEDGVSPTFEIDNEEKPYVRKVLETYPHVETKLKNIDPKKFEEVCAWILSGLNAVSESANSNLDGGVDFMAEDFDFVPEGFSTPNACRIAIIGQAKRYKDGRAVTESDVRKFIGGGLKRRHELIRMQKIKALSPVVYAFWTTSKFDPNARLYARDMGLWYMEGATLAKYCNDLNLLERILALPDHPII